MTGSERIDERNDPTSGRVDELTQQAATAENVPAGPWVTRWEGQEFCVAAEGAEQWDNLAEWTFLIHPGNSDEQAECDTRIGEWMVAARTGWPDAIKKLLAVLELHHAGRDVVADRLGIEPYPGDVCVFCAENWPCTTVRAVSGDQS